MRKIIRIVGGICILVMSSQMASNVIAAENFPEYQSLHKINVKYLKSAIDNPACKTDPQNNPECFTSKTNFKSKYDVDDDLAACQIDLKSNPVCLKSAREDDNLVSLIYGGGTNFTVQKFKFFAPPGTKSIFGQTFTRAGTTAFAAISMDEPPVIPVDIIKNAQQIVNGKASINNAITNRTISGLEGANRIRQLFVDFPVPTVARGGVVHKAMIAKNSEGTQNIAYPIGEGGFFNLAGTSVPELTVEERDQYFSNGRWVYVHIFENRDGSLFQWGLSASAEESYYENWYRCMAATPGNNKGNTVVLFDENGDPDDKNGICQQCINDGAGCKAAAKAKGNSEPPAVVSPPPAVVSPPPTVVSPPPSVVSPPPSVVSPPPSGITAFGPQSVTISVQKNNGEITLVKGDLDFRYHVANNEVFKVKIEVEPADNPKWLKLYRDKQHSIIYTQNRILSGNKSVYTGEVGQIDIYPAIDEKILAEILDVGSKETKTIKFIDANTGNTVAEKKMMVQLDAGSDNQGDSTETLTVEGLKSVFGADTDINTEIRKINTDTGENVDTQGLYLLTDFAGHVLPSGIEGGYAIGALPVVLSAEIGGSNGYMPGHQSKDSEASINPETDQPSLVEFASELSLDDIIQETTEINLNNVTIGQNVTIRASIDAADLPSGEKFNIYGVINAPTEPTIFQSVNGFPLSDQTISCADVDVPTGTCRNGYVRIEHPLYQTEVVAERHVITLFDNKFTAQADGTYRFYVAIKKEDGDTFHYKQVATVKVNRE